MTTVNKELYDAIAELAQANDRLERARLVTSQARSEETDALNCVNAAQKKINALLDPLKQQAPSGTDWYDQIRSKR